MRSAPIAPWPLRWLQWMLVRAAVDLVPRRVRDVLGLDERWSLAAYERPVVSLLGRGADRLMIPGSPAVLACPSGSTAIPVPYDESTRLPPRRDA